MVKFLWRLSFLTFACLALTTNVSAQEKSELVRYPGTIISIKEDASSQGEMKITYQVGGCDQVATHNWLGGYKFYVDGKEVRMVEIKTPARAVFMYEKNGALQEVRVITKPEDRAKRTTKKGCDCYFVMAATSQDKAKPHLPTPPFPNCQCGCTVTGKCTCKDCDHPCLEAPKNAQQPRTDVKLPYVHTRACGLTVKMVWNSEHSLYVPDEDGWSYDFKTKLWNPPTPPMPPVTGYAGQFGGFQGQASGGCANGQCSPSAGSGGRGLFRRR